MSLLTGLSISLRNQISRELYDYTKNLNGFVALLAAMDNYWGVTERFTRSEDTAGESMQVDYRAGLPAVQGAKAITGTLASLQLDAQSGFSVISGTLPWSHYQLREDIRKGLVEHLAQSPKSVLPYLKKVAQAARDAVMQKLSEDMFPVTNCAPTLASGVAGNAVEDKVLAVAYPLQSGYVNNAATGSGTYPYIIDDLNATGYTGIKAITAGTVASNFGPASVSNIRRQLIIPLKNRGAKPDLGICDSTIYDYMLTQAEAKVVMEMTDKMNYGGELVRYAGLNWMVEERMDQLADTLPGTEYRELYLLQTDTWEFRQKGAFKDFDVIQNPFTATLLTMLGYFSCGLICKHPRFNGRGFNVLTS